MPCQAKGDNMSSLLHRIHSIKNKEELAAMVPVIQNDPEFPTASSSLYLKRYYKNHIAREINKKIYSFGVEDQYLISPSGPFHKPDHDGGLRPKQL